MLLSSAVWLMLQERISPDDLKEATRHLRYFAYQMDALYGKLDIAGNKSHKD